MPSSFSSIVIPPSPTAITMTNTPVVLSFSQFERLPMVERTSFSCHKISSLTKKSYNKIFRLLTSLKHVPRLKKFSFSHKYQTLSLFASFFLDKKPSRPSIRILSLFYLSFSPSRV